jgi:hypothetical protein
MLFRWSLVVGGWSLATKLICTFALRLQNENSRLFVDIGYIFPPRNNGLCLNGFSFAGQINGNA